MRSKSMFAILWIAATVVAGSVAWRSLDSVAAVNSNGDVRSAAASDDGFATTSDPIQSGVASDDNPVENTNQSSIGETTPNDQTSATDAGTMSTSSTTGDHATTSPPSSTTTGGAQTDPVDRTFHLIGGSTAIRFSPGGTSVLWSTPASGYTVESHAEDDGVEVEFKNGELESKLVAWWSNGPKFEEEEDRED